MEGRKYSGKGDKTGECEHALKRDRQHYDFGNCDRSSGGFKSVRA